MKVLEARHTNYEQQTRICKRYEGLVSTMDHNRMTRMMDLELVQCNIDWERLEQFPDGDFIHDVSGIHSHIDRRTGKLVGCFVPRCAQ